MLVKTKRSCALIAAGLAAVIAASFVVGRASADASSAQAQQMLAIATAVSEGREACYSTRECPNLAELMDLFTADAKRTEVQRNNNLVLLEGPDALRADHLRVAASFTGRQLETTGMTTQGRNVVVLQRNWDPGVAEPNPFIHVFRIEGGKVAHWVLVAP